MIKGLSRIEVDWCERRTEDGTVIVECSVIKAFNVCYSDPTTFNHVVVVTTTIIIIIIPTF